MTNRLVLVSDGGANLGVTSADLIAQKAWLGDGRDVFILGIGVGDPSSYNDTLMDTVTDAGRGAAVFIDTADEAWTMLHDRFLEVFEVAVTDVRLELELPERMRVVEHSAEEVAVNPQQVRPQYLAPNAEMVFYNELSAPVPSCVDDGDVVVARATFTDPTGVPQVVQEVFTLGELRSGGTDNILKGRALFAYGEALKASNTPGGPNLANAKIAAYTVLDAADLALPSDPDLAEIRSVLDAL